MILGSEALKERGVQKERWVKSNACFILVPVVQLVDLRGREAGVIKQQGEALEEAERLEREALTHRERAVAYGLLYQRLLHGRVSMMHDANLNMQVHTQIIGVSVLVPVSLTRQYDWWGSPRASKESRVYFDNCNIIMHQRNSNEIFMFLTDQFTVVRCHFNVRNHVDLSRPTC